MGCADVGDRDCLVDGSTQHGAGELAQVSGVDYVVGLNRLDDLLRFVESPASASSHVAVGNIKRERGVPVLGTRALPGHTRAFLKIQEGCNYTCTYCIIPSARGLSRSVIPRWRKYGAWPMPATKKSC